MQDQHKGGEEMSITSSFFMFVFLPVILFLYFIIKNIKIRIIILLTASLFFYAWGDMRSVPVFLGVLSLNWIIAVVREKSSNNIIRKTIQVIALVINISVLVLYKYLNFLLGLIPNGIFGEIPQITIMMPLGISFFIFKVISFQIDSYKKPELVNDGIVSFCLYVSFFPQILSGPITRYEDFKNQLKDLGPQSDRFSNGAELFARGLIKKILIAEQISVIANEAFVLISPGAPMAWLGAIAYMLQLYFDFSGYSDMAIGLGMFFGIVTPDNFNHPYIACSVQDFWRRWHISLSRWFRDYVYFPLGGSRCALSRTCINIGIVFALTGLWHGANFTFLVWGLYHGFFLILERTVLKNALKKTPKPIKWLYAMLVVLIGWILFRADNIQAAISYIGNLFNFTENGIQQLIQYVSAEKAVAIVAGCVFAFPIWNRIRESLLLKASMLYYIVLSVFFLVAICYLIGNGFSPFLYIQF